MWYITSEDLIDPIPCWPSVLERRKWRKGEPINPDPPCMLFELSVFVLSIQSIRSTVLVPLTDGESDTWIVMSASLQEQFLTQRKEERTLTRAHESLRMNENLMAHFFLIA